MKYFKKQKKLCTILVDRANFGRLYPVMKELNKSKKIDQKILVSGSMLLNRFGNTIDIVKKNLRLSQKFILSLKVQIILQ